MNIRPLKGNCFAVLDIECQEIVKGVYIPEAADVRRRRGRRGKVIAETPADRGMRGLVGRTMLFHSAGGSQFEWEGQTITVFPMSSAYIIAEFHEGEWEPIPEVADGRRSLPGEVVKRCPRCRTKGEGNMILDPDGVCPRCGRKADGRKPEMYTHTFPDGTKSRPSRTPPRLSEAFRDAHEDTVKGGAK